MRAVVCGTRFGQVYLEAFRNPDIPVRLAGILANGSDRSRACARHYGVPLFTSPEQIPGDVDIACVVVRGGLLGGAGADLAIALMQRGLHVLQEHPLHADELAACLRQARTSGVVYHVNSFYVHIEPVRRFLAAVRELTATQRVLWVDAACGFQLAYSLLDLLGQALGGVRPFAFAAPPDTGVAQRLTELDVPFRSLDGVLAGVPVTLRVQNQMDPADPDGQAHLMHRATIGTEGGNLTLVSTHGPVVWSGRPDFPRVGEADAQPHFARAAAPDDRLAAPSATVLGPADAPGFRPVFESVWSAGVAHALTGLVAAIGDRPVAARHGQYHLALCQVWQEMTALLGPPQLLHAKPPRLLAAGEIAALAAAADRAGSSASPTPEDS